MLYPAPTEYALRHELRRTQQDRWIRRGRWVTHARLITFAAGVAVVVWVFRSPDVSSLWIALPFLAFIALVVMHERSLRQARRARRCVEYYERALARLQDAFAGCGKSGDRYLDDRHPYAPHLDLFGFGSLFELLSNAQTRGGEDCLARWLLAPATRDVLEARHDAIRELVPRIDFREDLAVLGPDVRKGVDPDVLARWGREGPAAPPVRSRWLAGVLAATTVVAAVAVFAGLVGLAPFLVAVVAELGFSMRWRPYVVGLLRDVDRTARDLALLEALLARIERESFEAPRLQELQRALESEGLPPSAQIERLRRLSELLDARRNQLFAPLAPFLLWTTQFAFAIAAWREVCGPKLGTWLEIIAEVEALCDLATYSYEHPADVFPAIEEGAVCLDAEALGHPLIPESACVRNDVRLDPEHALYVVSGSNMSGKSTWLRAIGTNVVLALAGAPVRARSMRLAPFSVGASIRIQDSLRDHSSRFYAEIQCLRRIVDLSDGPLPVLFLLDEILAGTNSHDRGVGAAAVVRGLLERGAVGLLTTHDLALAKIADELGARACNVHFEDQLDGDVMRFDYRLHEGVVQKSNALALMRAVGLGV